MAQKTRAPIESKSDVAGQPYPSSAALGTLGFTAAGVSGTARVLAVLPPIRGGHGRRLRLHVDTPLTRGQRLRDLDLKVEGGDRLGLGAELRVATVKPLVPDRPKGQRGNRIRRAVRRWDAAAQKAKATGVPEPAKPAEKRRDKRTAPKPVAGGKPESRPKRTATGWSVIVEI